jgi:transcriptional regulator with XRE-family HTH domain
VARRLRYAAPLAERPAVALRVREARLALGLTQRDLADLLSINRVTVTLAESGRRTPTHEIVAWLDSLDGVA